LIDYAIAVGGCVTLDRLDGRCIVFKCEHLQRVGAFKFRGAENAVAKWSAARSGNSLNTAEVYDPAANTFTPLSVTMTSARVAHTSTLLPSGQVLIAGGGRGRASIGSFTIVNTAEVYDPVANTFTPLTATMTTGRGQHTATLLPNGQVLLTGGSKGTSGTALATVDLYTSSVLSNAIAATDTCVPVSDLSTFSSRPRAASLSSVPS